MRRIFAFVICLCFLPFGRPALAYFEPVYAPLISDPANAINNNSPLPAAPADNGSTNAPAAPAAPDPVLANADPTVSVAAPADQTAAEPAAPAAPETVIEATPLPTEAAPRSVMSAVARAKVLLAPVLEDFKKKEKGIKPLASKTGQTAAALAIWDKKTDTVTVYGGTRGLKYFTADDNGPVIPIVTSSGAQTAYRDNDPNTVVVGAVQASMTAVTVKKKKRYAPAFSYYVPYTKELYAPETLAAGSDYLSSLIADAFADLDAKGIKSRAFPDRALTAVVDPYLIKSIAVVEHADSQIFDNDDSEDSLGRFLVKLALNKEDALGSAVSSAGARGMVQFIPSTYKLMVTKRPDLGLIPDFVQGMDDHKNAVKAEAAYLDMILADLPDSVKTLYQTDRGAAAEYLAAGYNGGSVRVKKAIQDWGADWSASHGSYAELTAKAKSLRLRIAQIDKKLAAGGLSKQKTADLKAERKTDAANRATALADRDLVNSSALRSETVAYIVKLRRVYDMLAAGFFATPNPPAAPSGVAAATAPVALASNN